MNWKDPNQGDWMPGWFFAGAIAVFGTWGLIEFIDFGLKTLRAAGKL